MCRALADSHALSSFVLCGVQEVEKRARMKAQVLLRLFKVVFGSVTLFPKNERMLRPHLQTIVLSCLRYTTRVKDPTNYYFLLRALFRSISGGKFESSYKVRVFFLPFSSFRPQRRARKEFCSHTVGAA